MNLTDIKCRLETVNHSGMHGVIQQFNCISVFSRSASTATFDGILYSDWILEKEGQLYVPVDSPEVDYNDDYIGQDIILKPMNCIYIPEANKETQPYMDALASHLQIQIGKQFNRSLNLPFVLDV